MLHKHVFSKILLFVLGLLLFACPAPPKEPLEKLIIGVVSYEGASDLVNRYYNFQDYLAVETKTVIELEPSFNERKAIDRIERRVWSIVFAPPGLAAIAIDRQGYIPIFALAGRNLDRSWIVVREDSNLEKLEDLSEKTLALGQRGSATGYYLPLYDLHGLTLSSVRFAPTPKTVLNWVEEQNVDAGAISREQFNKYRGEFLTRFRVLHQTRLVPSGVVLINPDLAPKLQNKIKEAMKQAPTYLTKDAGYLPHAPVPNYQNFITLVNKVRPVEKKVDKQPAVLLKD